MYGKFNDFREFLDAERAISTTKIPLTDGRKGYRVIPNGSEKIAESFGLEVEEYRKMRKEAEYERKMEMKLTIDAMKRAGMNLHDIAIAMGHPEPTIQEIDAMEE